MEAGGGFDTFIEIANGITALALSLACLYAFFKGLVIPAPVVEAIIQKTVAAVLKETREDYEQMLMEMMAEITARTLKAIDEMEREQMTAMQRSLKELREFLEREMDRAEWRELRRQTSPLDTGILERSAKDD